MVVVWSLGVIRWWFELVRVVRLSGQDQDKSSDNVLSDCRGSRSVVPLILVCGHAVDRG